MSGNQYNTPGLSKIDHIPVWNAPRHHDGPLPPRFIAFVPPTDAAPVTNGNMAMRSNGCYSSNFCSQYQNYQTANQGALQNSSVFPSHTQPGASYHPVARNGCPTIVPWMDNRRPVLKRKVTDINLAAEGTSSSGYHAGSSSNLPFPTDQLQYDHIPAPPCRSPAAPFHLAPTNWNDNLMSTGDQSLRHVRGRSSHAFPLAPAQPATYSSSNMHRFFYPSSSAAAIVPEQWRNAPTAMASQVRILPTGIPASNTAIPRGREYLTTHYNNPGAPLTTLRGPEATIPPAHNSYLTTHYNNPGAPMTTLRGPEATLPPTHNSFSQWTAPHEAIPTYRHSASTTASVGAGLPYGPEVAASLTHPRHGIAGHGSSGRNRRARTSYFEIHSMVGSENSLSRWASEGFVLIDPSFYGSGELIDPHWDMRLDIDNMSYEELLDLEERIGDVSRGLPDETISTCLTEIACCSSNDSQSEREGKCVICLEEHKDGNKLGMLDCGHGFHADCIKKWLQVKNCCPVCKAAASQDTNTAI